MEWFISEKIAVNDEPKEHGLISFYLGICYKENGQKEEVLKIFQVTVDYLQDANWEFYDAKCELAEDYIKELGGIPIKKTQKRYRFYNYF